MIRNGKSAEKKPPTSKFVDGEPTMNLIQWDTSNKDTRFQPFAKSFEPSCEYKMKINYLLAGP